VSDAADELRNRRFGARDVERATNMPRDTVHTWIKRRYVEVPSEGQGKSRRFTFGDVIELATLAELTRAGLTISAAAVALASVRPLFREVLQDRFAEGQTMAIGAGRAWILPSDVIAGFMRDQRVSVYTALIISNVAINTYEALPRAPAVTAHHAVLSGTGQLHTEETTKRTTRAPSRKLERTRG
jgi:hypothetical protein